MAPDRTHITPAMRDVVGLELRRGVSFPITDSDIRKWAIAVYYPEPAPKLFWDAEYAATTVHGDPLGLVRRTVAWTERTELFVHPLTVSLESLGAGLLRDLEGTVTPDLSMSDLAFHALREYQPGDDRRYIHWRSSAKHDRLLVRQFLDTRRSHLAVVVDTSPEVYARDVDDVAIVEPVDRGARLI